MVLRIDARSGLTAPLDAFESEGGFFRLFADAAPEPAAVELGRRYAVTDPGVALKLYPACSATQAAAEATLELVHAHGLSADQVAKVHCESAPLAYASLPHASPRTVTEGQFSMPYAIGCMLAYGEFTVRQLTQETVDDPLLRAQLPKVEMTRSEELVATEQGRRDHQEG